MSAFLWILTGILATGLFIYALRLPDRPKDEKDHKPGC